MFAVWFTFEKNDEKYLYGIIEKLGKQFDAPIFLPHITAYGLVDIKIDQLEKIVVSCINEEKPFIVEKMEISHSDDFWKTVFIEIYPNGQLERINKQLTKSMCSFGKYKFNPHVSLIYKKMTILQRESLTKSINIKNKYKINGLCIQQFSKDISKWEIIHRYSLK